MLKTILRAASTLLVSGTIYAAGTLDSYDAIKQEVMDGKAIKLVADFSKCKVTESDNSGRGMRNIVGLRIDNWMISDRTQAIYTSHHFLNSLDKKNRYGLKGYRRDDIAIMPTNEVVIETDTLTLPEYKTQGPVSMICKVAEGAKFYKVD